VTRVDGAHHILGIEGLGGELWDGEDTVVLGLSRGKWGESNEEEVKTREWNHVHGKLTKIAIQLTGETKGACGSGDGLGDEVVQVFVGWVVKLECTEADIVKGFVIKGEALVGVLNKLVDGEGGVVRLNDSVRNLGARNDRVSTHDTIGVILTNLGNQKGSHTGSGTSSHGVSDLKSLKHVTALGFLTDDIHDAINKLGSFGVVALGPVISSSALSVDKVIGAEDLSVKSAADGVHGSWLQIGEDSTGNVTSTHSFVKVHIDALQLDGVVSNVSSINRNSMFLRHGLPELSSDLVTALTDLDVNDFSHDEFECKKIVLQKNENLNVSTV
jgi:hypothetical protein